MFTKDLLPVCAGLIVAGGGVSVWVYRALWRTALAGCATDIDGLIMAFRNDDVGEESRGALGSRWFWLLDRLREVHEALV